MGCITSNTAAYPGNNRVAKPVYQPPESDYKQVDSTIAVANVHFVACPGGNALKLVGKPNSLEPKLQWVVVGRDWLNICQVCLTIV